jgi:hypothetical protein
MAATRMKRRTVRQDPVSRLIDPTLAWTQLENEDPTKYYVPVHRSTMQMSKYQALGYEVEVYRKGGVKPKAVRNVEPLLDKDIEIRDCVLMSIDKEVRDEADREGWALVDQMYAKIHNKRAVQQEAFGKDIPFRRNGSGEPLIDVEDDSSPFQET